MASERSPIDKERKRELAKATANIGAARTDFYLVKRWQAAIIMGSAAVMLVGLLLPMAVDRLAADAAGYALVVAGAVAILVTYLAMRFRGPLNYTVYYYRTTGGEEVELQFITRKRILFAGKGKVVEYDRGNVGLAETLYRPGTPWNWFESVEFAGQTLAGGGRDRRFFGVRNGKKAMLSLRRGHIDYAEADGMRLRYFDINDLRGKVGVPEAFLSAVKKLGFSDSDLPFMCVK